MNIAVVGTGYVGLVTGAVFADLGNDATCVDKDVAKIEGLQAGRMPIYEPGLEELVARNVADGRLSFTTDLAEAVRRSDIIFIAVGTPPKASGESDLSAVEEVALGIAWALDRYKVIVNKSTVPVGTADRVRETPGVAWAEPIRSTTGMVSSPDGRAVTYVIGYDPAARHGGPSRLVAGLPPRSGEAVVDRQAADQLGVAVGQQVHVLGEPFTVTGLSTDGTNIANTTVFIPPATSPGCVAPPKAMCWSAPSPASTSACFPSGGCCVWTPPPRSGGPHEHPDRDRPHRPGRGPARHRAHQDLRPG